MERERTDNMSDSGYRLIAAVARLLGELLRSIVSLLASSAKASDTQENQFDGAFKGGSYNYRTRKFDDGTDPIGWYSNEYVG